MLKYLLAVVFVVSCASTADAWVLQLDSTCVCVKTLASTPAPLVIQEPLPADYVELSDEEERALKLIDDNHEPAWEEPRFVHELFCTPNVPRTPEAPRNLHIVVLLDEVPPVRVPEPSAWALVGAVALSAVYRFRRLQP